MTRETPGPRGPNAMLRRFTLALLLMAAALAGCDQAKYFDSFMPKEEVEAAKAFVALVAARDSAGVEAALAPKYRTPELPAQLEAMAKIIPAGSPRAVQAVGANTKMASGSTTYDITLEYEYPDTWLLASVRLERRDGKLTPQGINVTPREQSLEAENRFTLDGKGPPHYIVLALAVAIPLIVLYALVLCIRTKFVRRKWLWVLFISVGLMQFHFNWSTGELGIQPLAFMLLGAGFYKSGLVAPWMFTLAAPVGAIVFLVRRRRLRRESAAAAALDA